MAAWCCKYFFSPCILATVLQHGMVHAPHINCTAAAKILGLSDQSEAQINTETNTPYQTLHSTGQHNTYTYIYVYTHTHIQI